MSTSKLGRYAQLAAMCAKYGRRDFLEAIDAEIDTGPAVLDSATEGGRGPEDLVADITELGPTFIKLGQMLSTRKDLLSEPYLDALAALQDDVEPMPAQTVERLLSERLQARPSQLFASFDSDPTAAASLGQVHRATLRDGREVVVKIQRPDIRAGIEQDLDMLAELAGAVDRHSEIGRRYEFSRLVEHFRESLLNELDYRTEANNLSTLADELAEFEDIVVPRPVDDLVSEKILVMEYVDGTSVSAIGPLMRTETDFSPLAKALCEAYLHQILVVGFFQSDPHPGNVLVLPDNRLALIDFGMVAHVESSLREQLLRLLLALCNNKGRETAELLAELGEYKADANPDRFIQQVGDLVTRRQRAAPSDRKLGLTLLQVVSIYAQNDIRPPAEIGLLGKTLLLLDEVSRMLAPQFDADEVLGAYAQTLLQKHLLQKLSPQEMAGKLLDSSSAIERFPRQVQAILRALSRGEMRFRVDALDEKNLLRSLERIGNRIAMGLVLAALIVGAALMMSIETSLTLFGYPALAILLFLGAAVLGLSLVIQIMTAERREKRGGNGTQRP